MKGVITNYTSLRIKTIVSVGHEQGKFKKAQLQQQYF